MRYPPAELEPLRVDVGLGRTGMAVLGDERLEAGEPHVKGQRTSETTRGGRPRVHHPDRVRGWLGKARQWDEHIGGLRGSAVRLPTVLGAGDGLVGIPPPMGN